MALSSSSGSLSEVTIRKPLGNTSLLIGWMPYQAHDSTPLHMVSSTQIDTSTAGGSYLASDCSSSTSSVATTAKFLAGTPLRSGESPYRAKAVPTLPSRRGGGDPPPRGGVGGR